MTSWSGIVSVEATDLGFFSEAPELLWRGRCVTHIPEVVLFLGATRVAIVPALGRWFDTIENNATVEVVSDVGFSLTIKMNLSSLSEGG